MVDYDLGSLTGSAADYMGFGYEPFGGATVTSPVDVGTPTDYVTNAPIEGEYGSYTPTFNFDFSSFFPTTSFATGPTSDYFTGVQAKAPVFSGQPFSGVFQAPGGEALTVPVVRDKPAVRAVDPFAGVRAEEARFADRKGIGQVPEGTAAPQEKGFLQDLLGGLKTADILKLALGAGGAIMGSQAQQRAIDDAARARAEYEKAYKGAGKEFKSLAAPVLTPGYTQLSQAVQGAFSPASMQAFQAAQAQLAQGASSAGGMGAVQSAEALNRIRNQILESQTKTALALIGAGEPMAVNAINADLQGTTGGLKMELDMSQMANEASMRMYQSIASAIGSGFGSGAQYAQSRVG